MNEQEAILFGDHPDERLVAIEPVDGGPGGDICLFFRRDGQIQEAREVFRPFCWIDSPGRMKGAPVGCSVEKLEGEGVLRARADFESWADFKKAEAWLKKESGANPSDPRGPYAVVSDPVQQHLMMSGRTLFKGMAFEDLLRFQFDIETYTEPGFEFSNPNRAGDRVIAVAMADSSGWTEVLSGAEMDEKTLLETFVERVRERDPDVIEGHNLFRFDLAFLKTRARRHKVKLRLGRDGSEPTTRPSRYVTAERTITYPRFNVFGRHIVDTYLLALAYDTTHRSLEGHGLKDVAVHFGVAAPDRTYLEGRRIAETFDREPETLMRYARDDVIETRAIADILSRSYFVQAQMLPFGYQTVCVRGQASKIDALMLRAYARLGLSLPKPGEPHPFEGGYTDVFFTGVARNVHHCDVRSLYPSIMLKDRIGPGSDTPGLFLEALERLRDLRLRARKAMREASDENERRRLDAQQTTFKILINSFYGYLGFGQARFADFDAAARIAAEGRALLRKMVASLRALGATPIEIDTDGLYFVPPEGGSIASFRKAFIRTLPPGIEVEFDGDYRAMFSYKMKNYALLDDRGELIVKGAALKSRGLEPFQRTYMASWLRLKLEGRDDEIASLTASFREAIEQRRWPIERLAKTETLQEAPERYAEKKRNAKRGRSAVYELALKAERPYGAGDQLSYYVSGTRKGAPVHEAARPVVDWDPENRDENVAYYLGKLDALAAKLDRIESEDGETHEQSEWTFDD